jgi:hypothetical protein
MYNGDHYQAFQQSFAEHQQQMQHQQQMDLGTGSLYSNSAAQGISKQDQQQQYYQPYQYGDKSQQQQQQGSPFAQKKYNTRSSGGSSSYFLRGQVQTGKQSNVNGNRGGMVAAAPLVPPPLPPSFVGQHHHQSTGFHNLPGAAASTATIASNAPSAAESLSTPSMFAAAGSNGSGTPQSTAAESTFQAVDSVNTYMNDEMQSVAVGTSPLAHHQFNMPQVGIDLPPWAPHGMLLLCNIFFAHSLNPLFHVHSSRRNVQLQSFVSVRTRGNCGLSANLLLWTKHKGRS